MTLHYAVNPGGGPDPIGNTATVVDGVATFSELAIDTPGIGYRFWAISGKLIGPASDLFDIGDSVTPCHPGALCDSGPLTAPANDAQVRAVADRATTTRALTAFFGGTELSCGSGRSIANVNVQDRSKTITFAVLGQNRDYRTKAPGSGCVLARPPDSRPSTRKANRTDFPGSTQPPASSRVCCLTALRKPPRPQ